MIICTTERLTIRQLSTDDAEFILTLLNQPDFLRFIGDRQVRNVDDARRYIISGPQQSYIEYGFGLWLMCLSDTGQPVGMCGLLKRASLDWVDIGYALAAKFAGQGMASEAVTAVINCAAYQFGIAELAAIVAPDNQRSVNLLRKQAFEYSHDVQLPPDGSNCQLYLKRLS